MSKKMIAERHILSRPDIPLELSGFVQRCRRRIFLEELADRLLPALLVAALVSLIMLLARGCWLNHRILAAALLVLSLTGFILPMAALEYFDQTAGDWAAFWRNRSGLREARRRPRLMIAAAIGLLAWLVLPAWALVITLTGVCAGLAVLRTRLHSAGETAWMLDRSNGGSGALVTAVDGASPQAADAAEKLFRRLVQQNALRLLASATCPPTFHVQRNRIVAASTGVTALAVAMVLLIGPPAARPWNVLALRPSGRVPQPSQLHASTPLSHSNGSSPAGSPRPAQRTWTKPPAGQPGHAPGQSGSSSGAQPQQKIAAAVQQKLMSNSAYRHMAAGAAGMAAGTQTSSYFSRLTRKEKQNLAATIRLAEKDGRRDPKLLAKLQKLAVAATGSSAATFSVALERIRKTLRDQLAPAKPGHTHHGQPVPNGSAGHGLAGDAGGSSSGITGRPSGPSSKMGSGYSAGSDGNATVLHVPEAGGSGNFAAEFKSVAVTRRLRDVPQRYRNLIRRYFSHR